MLDKLLVDAQRRKFDAVMVWKIDRLGRSLKHLVVTLADLSALGVAFISLRDNLALSTPSGRLMFQMIGAFAEFEKSLICERVRAGLVHAKAKGQRLGRPGRSVDVPTLLRLRGEGKTWPEIAEETGIPLRTCHRAVAAQDAKNPAA